VIGKEAPCVTSGLCTSIAKTGVAASDNAAAMKSRDAVMDASPNFCQLADGARYAQA
jgi:hypothetical protein